MSTKFIEYSTKFKNQEQEAFMNSGAAFRYELEKIFPPRGERRAQWFFKIGQATGIPAKRLEKLSYDEKCALQAHELVKIQKAAFGRISSIRLSADQLHQKQGDIENDAIHELCALCEQILETFGNYSARSL